MVNVKLLTFLLIGIVLSVGAVAKGALAADRIALVIGNENYPALPKLLNGIGSANLIAQTLEKTGFEVTKLLDANLEQMKEAATKFGTRADAKTKLFFYAGNAVQVAEINYLLPVDTATEGNKDFSQDAYTLGDLFNALDGSDAVKLIFLDCDRINPFPVGKSPIKDKGLARVPSPQNTLLAFSTQPGNSARRGEKSASAYSLALSTQISQQGVNIEKVLSNVRNQVGGETSFKQIPWVASSLVKDFFFVAE